MFEVFLILFLKLFPDFLINVRDVSDNVVLSFVLYSIPELLGVKAREYGWMLVQNQITLIFADLYKLFGQRRIPSLAGFLKVVHGVEYPFLTSFFGTCRLDSTLNYAQPDQFQGELC